MARRVYPDPVVVTLVQQCTSAPVSTRASGAVSQLPAVRVTVIGAGAGGYVEWADVVAQVDVWAGSEVAAGDLAHELANAWAELPAPPGDTGDAYVSGAWIDSWPRPLPDPDTDAFRSFLTVGLRVHPLESHG